MDPIATTSSIRRRLPVWWLEEASEWTLLLREREEGHGPSRAKASAVARPSCQAGGSRPERATRAFTLLEMMMVIAIIGFIAAMTLPHLSGFTRANTLAAANRQLLEDLAFARQRALANRSTVYMVFVPPSFWTNAVYEQSSNNIERYGLVNPTYQFMPMLARQYVGYALLAMNTVGDQPGQHYAHYLTDWRTLPPGVFISQFEFQSNLPPLTISTTNSTTGVTNAAAVYPLSWTPPIPFPSVASGTSNSLPYIGFSPQGGLTEQVDQYIALTRGSLFFPETTNGASIAGEPDVVATPVGNETNNPNLIRIDWLTSRATLLQNQF